MIKLPPISGTLEYRIAMVYHMMFLNLHPAGAIRAEAKMVTRRAFWGEDGKTDQRWRMLTVTCGKNQVPKQLDFSVGRARWLRHPEADHGSLWFNIFNYVAIPSAHSLPMVSNGKICSKHNIKHTKNGNKTTFECSCGFHHSSKVNPTINT